MSRTNLMAELERFIQHAKKEILLAESMMMAEKFGECAVHLANSGNSCRSAAHDAQLLHTGSYESRQPKYPGMDQVDPASPSVLQTGA
jgi:hypothetical protein